MAILPIRPYGDPVLQKSCLAVSNVDGKLMETIQSMLETLYTVPGIGIAAPQVGLNLRFFVYDMNRRAEKTGRSPVVLLNPEIIESEGSVTEDEGCLSFPGIFVPLPRHERIGVRGHDPDGRIIELSGSGLFSRLIQHEMDHLDGLLLRDRMTLWDRARLSVEMEKIKRKGNQSRRSRRG